MNIDNSNSKTIIMNRCKSLRCVANILFAVCMFAGTLPGWSVEPTNESNILKGIQIGILCYDLDTDAHTASVTYKENGYHEAHVTIPPSVTYQGKTYTVTKVGGFPASEELLSVVIPNTVTTIEYAAFINCTNLTSVNIPNSVTVIEGEAFEWCFSLSSLTIGDNVETIGSFAFAVCRSLRSITIPRSTKVIGSDAFIACNSLTSVTIPANVIKINQGAFAACANLKEFIVEPGNAMYCASDGVLFNKEMTRLVQYPAGKQTIFYGIPDGVAWIANGAFTECQYLKSLFIPSSVKILGEKSIEFSSLPEYMIFQDCVSLVSITYPNGLDLSKAGVPETTKCIAH